MVAHVAGYQAYTAAYLHYLQTGDLSEQNRLDQYFQEVLDSYRAFQPEFPAHLNDLEGDSLNAVFAAGARSLSVRDVLADERQSYQALLDIVQSFPENELTNPARLGGKSLLQRLPNQSYNHYRMHMPIIRKWLEQQEAERRQSRGLGAFWWVRDPEPSPPPAEDPPAASPPPAAASSIDEMPFQPIPGRAPDAADPSPAAHDAAAEEVQPVEIFPAPTPETDRRVPPVNGLEDQDELDLMSEPELPHTPVPITADDDGPGSALLVGPEPALAPIPDREREHARLMHTGFTRLTGVVVLIGAIFGLILSAFGLFALWSAKPTITSGILDVVALTSRTLDASDSMLQAINSSLEQASGDLALIRGILDDTSNTIGSSTDMMNDTADLMGEQMPQFIQNTQSSLTNVASTAQIVDDMLGAISNVPLLGPFLKSRYQPDVPLHTSVARVNRSLDPLPASFTSIQQDLQNASSSMSTVRADVDQLAQQVADIDTSVKDASQVVTDYQLILSELRARLTTVETRLPVLLDTLFLGGTVLLIWLAISQFGALLHAIEMLGLREQ